jgi:hypothetical protein
VGFAGMLLMEQGHVVRSQTFGWTGKQINNVLLLPLTSLDKRDGILAACLLGRGLLLM